jgi:hypothetical protein
MKRQELLHALGAYVSGRHYHLLLEQDDKFLGALLAYFQAGGTQQQMQSYLNSGVKKLTVCPKN